MSNDQENTTLSYAARLQMSDKELATSEAQSFAAEVEAELSSRISSINAQIVRANNALNGAMNRYPLDINVVENQAGKVEALETKLAGMKDIYRALFPG